MTATNKKLGIGAALLLLLWLLFRKKKPEPVTAIPKTVTPTLPTGSKPTGDFAGGGGTFGGGGATGSWLLPPASNILPGQDKTVTIIPSAASQQEAKKKSGYSADFDTASGATSCGCQS